MLFNNRKEEFLLSFTNFQWNESFIIFGFMHDKDVFAECKNWGKNLIWSNNYIGLLI